MHVLIVGDDEHCRHFLREVLGLAGALVTATSVIDALTVTQAADLIVCDSAVAWASGGNLLRRLQYLHFRRGREAPAIVLLPTRLDERGRAGGGLPVSLDEARRRRSAPAPCGDAGPNDPRSRSALLKQGPGCG